MEQQASNIDISKLLSTATAGILQIPCTNTSRNIPNSEQWNISDENLPSSASVVNFSPAEGENIIKQISSSQYKPQICIETGDYVTIIYKKCSSSQEEASLLSVKENAKSWFTDPTSTSVCTNESYQTVIESTDEDGSQAHNSYKLGSLGSNSNTSFSSNDSYLTAIESATEEGRSVHNSHLEESQESTFEELDNDLCDSSTSAVCGCNSNSHSHKSCRNIRRFVTVSEEVQSSPINFLDFYNKLYPMEGPTHNQVHPTAEKRNGFETSVTKRNKRILDHSLRVDRSSLNDSFPETIFPARKKPYTSTPVRKSQNNENPKNNLNLPSTLDASKINSKICAIEE